MRTWSVAVTALVLGPFLEPVVGSPAVAEAQYGTVLPGPEGELVCASELSRCGVADDASCEGSTTCRGVDSAGDGVCASPEALLCALSDSEEDRLCPDATVPQSFHEVDICVPATAGDLCGGSASCLHPPSDSTAIVDYAYGDCDADGLANARDPEPCRAPPVIGLVHPETGDCQPASVPCITDADCSEGARSLCREVSPTQDAPKYCVAADPVGLCCGADLACGNELACERFADEPFGVCHSWCRDHDWTYEERLGCVRDPAGSMPFVRPELGDCDDDGVLNEREEELGTDACDGSDVPHTPDGGSIARDAGGIDGSRPPSTEDPTVGPFIGGGGGCRCRATATTMPQSRGSHWWLGLLGILTLRRRRARAERLGS